MKDRNCILFDLDGTSAIPGRIMNSVRYALGHFGLEADSRVLRTLLARR